METDSRLSRWTNIGTQLSKGHSNRRMQRDSLGYRAVLIFPLSPEPLPSCSPLPESQLLRSSNSTSCFSSLSSHGNNTAPWTVSASYYHYLHKSNWCSFNHDFFSSCHCCYFSSHKNISTTSNSPAICTRQRLSFSVDGELQYLAKPE